MTFQAIGIAPDYDPGGGGPSLTYHPSDDGGYRSRLSAWRSFLDATDRSPRARPGCVECGRRDSAMFDFRCRRCSVHRDDEKRRLWARVLGRQPASSQASRSSSKRRFEPVVTAVQLATAHGGDIWAVAAAIGASVEYGDAKAMRAGTPPLDGFSLSDGGPRALIAIADDLRGLDRDCILAHEVAHVVAKQRSEEVSEAACDDFAVAFHVAAAAMRRGW